MEGWEREKEGEKAGRQAVCLKILDRLDVQLSHT